MNFQAVIWIKFREVVWRSFHLESKINLGGIDGPIALFDDQIMIFCIGFSHIEFVGCKIVL